MNHFLADVADKSILIWQRDRISMRLHVFLLNPVSLGSIPELPADSCKEIKASEGEQAVSDNYWLDLEKNGDPLNLYCDMTTDGGK